MKDCDTKDFDIEENGIYELEDGSHRKVIKIKRCPYANFRPKTYVYYSVVKPSNKTDTYSNKVMLGYFRKICIKRIA